MVNQNERAELHKTIWKIANDLRGAIDGWNFKAYVLGSIFYRFISENICDYIHHLMAAAGQPDFDYAAIDDDMAERIRLKMVQEKGYFILPSQLFQNVVQRADSDENLNEHLSAIFRSIEASAQGTESEDDLRGLFSDFAVDSAELGSTVIKRNQLLAKVLRTVATMDLGAKYNDTDNDTFGDTYEYLMQMYASEAGKSGGEFFTPQQVSELLARLASWQNPHIQKVYDPACGSGSLLLKFAKTIGRENPHLKYYGQEVNPTTYNLCRINMFLHNVNFDLFDIRLEDTLLHPQHKDEAPFDAIVSNPPYSLKWEGKDNPLLINDERYAPAGVLAPKSAADLAFTMHMLWHLSEPGTAAIVEFPGVLYRGGDEKKIRQYLVKNNFVDTVIQLPPNLFFGVGIATCIIVLKKSAKRDASVLFIDASKQFAKNGNKNVLLPEHQDRIMALFQNRKDELYLAKLVKNDDILANDANLSVSSYVEQEDTREVINISEVNTKLETLVKEGDELNAKIEAIIKELVNLEGKEGVEMKTSDFCLLKAGKSISADDIFEIRTGNVFPCIGGNGIRGYVSSYSHEGSYPVIGRQGALCGCVNWITGKFYATEHAVVATGKENTDQRFLYYLFENANLNQYKTQGAQPGLSVAKLNEVRFLIPSLSEQQRIVSILDTFESSIQNLEAQLAQREKQYEYYRNKLLSFEGEGAEGESE